MYLQWALNLDPKGSQRMFKDAAERHHLMEDQDIEDLSIQSHEQNDSHDVSGITVA